MNIALFFHLFLDEKVEPKINHDPSPSGSATAPALHTGTPTAWPARIVDLHRTLYLMAKRAGYAVRTDTGDARLVFVDAYRGTSLIPGPYANRMAFAGAMRVTSMLGRMSAMRQTTSVPALSQRMESGSMSMATTST